MNVAPILDPMYSHLFMIVMHDQIIDFKNTPNFKELLLPESEVLSGLARAIRNSGQWQFEIDMYMDRSSTWKKVVNKFKEQRVNPIYITILWLAQPNLAIEHCDTRTVLDFGWSYGPLSYDDASAAYVKLFFTTQEILRMSNAAPAVPGGINT